MNKLMEKPLFWPVVAILLLGVLTKGSVFVFVLKAGRYLLIAYLVYWLLSKLFKSVVTKKLSSFQENMMNAIKQQQEAAAQGRSAYGTPRKSDTENVIDLCPKCGQLKSPSCRTTCGS